MILYLLMVGNDISTRPSSDLLECLISVAREKNPLRAQPYGPAIQ
jgi:hypothetical protein